MKWLTFADRCSWSTDQNSFYTEAATLDLERIHRVVSWQILVNLLLGLDLLTFLLFFFT